MSILPTSNIRRYDDVEELVDISVSLPLFTTDTLAVYYGEAGLDAIENVDYEIILNETDYSNFTFRPLASLITKINAQIVAEPTDRNTILLVRILPAETDATSAGVRNTQFVSKEFDRIAMRFQQIDEQISRAVMLSVFNEETYLSLDLPPWAGGEYIIWHPTLKKLITASAAIPTATVDTDPTLAANSDLFVPSQKAAKTYIDAGDQILQDLIDGLDAVIDARLDLAEADIDDIYDELALVDAELDTKLPLNGSAPMTGPIRFTHQASPANPAAGLLSVFAKSDNRLYTRTSAGIETALGAGDVTRVADRTALKALDTTINTVAVLAEAGREGLFIWALGDYTARVAADTSEGVFVKATAISAGVGCWVRVYAEALNVRWFGAKGDAATDDITALDAAKTLSITLLAAVYIPAGKYRITATWNWGALTDHVHIVTDGRYKSQLLCDFAAGAAGVNIGTTAADSGYGVTVRDLGIVGIANMNTALSVIRVGNIEITDNWFYNGTGGLYVDRCYGFKIERNIAQNMSVLGFNVVASSGNNGLLLANGAYTTVIGLSINTCDNVHLVNNELADCTSVGLQFTGVKSMSADNNYIENNGVNVYMGGGGNHSIAFRDANWFGASTNPNVIEGVDGFVMENNVLFNCAWTRNQATAKNVHAENNYLTGTATFPAIDIVPKMMESVLLGNFTGADVNTAQPVFAAAQDTLSIETDTTYEFEAEYFITRAAGTTSHTTAVLFGGTATFDAIRYVADVSNPTGNVLGAVSRIRGDGATALTLTAANTSATENLSITLKGRIRTNVGGTLIPQFQFSAAPGGAPTVQSGSAFRIWPIGNDQVTAIGPWA